MDKQDYCEGCNQKGSCQEAYRQLGRSRGPSVVCKVMVAFLLPIVVFIASLAAFEQVSGKVVSGGRLQTALSLALALCVTFSVILIAKAISRRGGREK